MPDEANKLASRQWSPEFVPNAGTISVASWNILAQCYIPHHDMFPFTDRALLKWKRRSQAILDVICNLIPSEADDACALPDVLCMQEVDNFNSFFHGKLKKLGYGRVCYKPRTCGRRMKKDGSLIAFRRIRFELVDKTHLEFNDIALAAPSNNRVDDGEKYLVRDCVAAVCVLRDVVCGGLYVVASPHIYWDPECTDIKLLQAARLMQHLDNVARCHDDVRAIIVGGDLNSLPDSAMMRLLTEGVLDRKHKDCYNTTPQVADYIDRMLAECFVLDRFASAYSLSASHISTITHKFCGLLDYILYKELDDEPTVGDTTAVSNLELPTRQECQRAGVRALPSIECPSDHLPVCAQFSFDSLG